MVKILSVADLHGRKGWYAWLLEQIPDFDLVALPGDFVELYSQCPDEEQRFVLAWFTQAASLGVPLAWCSGNHDGRWVEGLRGPNRTGDGETKALTAGDGTPFVVTCLPYVGDPARIEALIARGAEERRAHGGLWGVLHHRPPTGLPISREIVDSGDPSLGPLIEQYQPDLVLCGHVHEAPFQGTFWAQLGRSICFNAGFKPDAAFPAHIEIDTKAGTATFRYENEEREHISESVNLRKLA